MARDAELRPLFPERSLQGPIEELAAFLVQFLGGPAEDSQDRRWLSLHQSHQHLRIERRHRTAWMRHMSAALDDAGIGEPARDALATFFAHASAYMMDLGTTAPRMNRELARRWHAQLALDKAVAAIRNGDADRAMKQAGNCDPAVLPGLLALMIDSGNSALYHYVRERLTEDPTLAQQRYGGRTLLHAAACAGSLAMVELLLRVAEPTPMRSMAANTHPCTVWGTSAQAPNRPMWFTP